MELIIGAPEQKKFNPYQAILSVMDFFKKFGALIGFVVGFGLLILGLVVVPDDPTNVIEHVIVVGAVFGMLLGAICGVLLVFLGIDWLAGGGWRNFEYSLRQKADNYGKVEDR